MQSITVTEKGANTKIEQYLQAAFPDLSFGALQKAFRRRDIKANGVRVGKDHIVAPGDRLEIFITDELLYGTGNIGRTASESKFSVAYEDNNLIIVNKAQGIPVHPDREQSHETLIDLVRVYLRERDRQQTTEQQIDRPQTDRPETDGQQTEKFTPNNHTLNNNSFQPELCHRLDRNTGGLVIIAKNKSSHDFIIEKLESREIKKYYQCLVAGKMEKKEANLQAYLWKDASKSRVFISDHTKPGAQKIITAYKVLEYDRERDISRLEIELITGRTHQIRAHMAYIGHPVIGDGKYGKTSINRAFGLKQQALWACRLKFDFAKNDKQTHQEHTEQLVKMEQQKDSKQQRRNDKTNDNERLGDNTSLVHTNMLKVLNGKEISIKPGFIMNSGKRNGISRTK